MISVRPNWRPRARWALLTLDATFLVVAGATAVVHGDRLGPEQVATLVPVIAFTVVGAVVTRRRPEAPLGWTFLVIGAVMLLNAAAAGICAVAADDGSRGPLVVGAALAISWTWPVALSLLVSFLPMLFPDGLPSPRWRPVAWLAAATTVAIGVVACLVDTLELAHDGPSIANPLGVLTSARSDQLFGYCLAIAFAIGVAALVDLVRRTVRSHGVLRVQMRWVTAALVLVPASLVVVEVVPVPGSSSSFNPLAVVSLTLLIVAMGVAITRYHLYDIDRVISRTTSYTVVTGLLLLVYAGIVTSTSRLLDTTSPLVVAVATLAAAALARPMLQRVQVAVDHRFDRARYDALLTIDDFGGRLRQEVDADAVSADLLSVVNGALAPGMIGLWLREAP